MTHPAQMNRLCILRSKGAVCYPNVAPDWTVERWGSIRDAIYGYEPPCPDVILIVPNGMGHEGPEVAELLAHYFCEEELIVEAWESPHDAIDWLITASHNLPQLDKALSECIENRREFEQKLADKAIRLFPFNDTEEDYDNRADKAYDRER